MRIPLTALEDRLFTEWRLKFYGGGVLVAFAIALATRLSQAVEYSWLFDDRGRPSCMDFSWMWLAGSVDPTRLYDHLAFSAARSAVAGVDACNFAANSFVYPPIYLLFVGPLSWLPYGTAFLVWILAGLAIYLAAIYLIVPRPVALILALSPFPVFLNVLLGHNGFLLAGLLGLALVLMERRPWVSGIALGLMSFKPQLCVLFPFVLLAARNWRTFASTAATCASLALAATILCGYQGWVSFIAAVGNRGADLSPDPLIPIWLESIYGFVQRAGIPASVAAAAQLSVAAVVAIGVCFVWARPVPHSLRAAALCGAALIVTPFVHGHDLCVLSIAAAFLIKDGLARGFMPGDRLLLLAAWVDLALISQLTGTGWIACLLVLGIVARRVWGIGATPASRFAARWAHLSRKVLQALPRCSRHKPSFSCTGRSE